MLPPPPPLLPLTLRGPNRPLLPRSCLAKGDLAVKLGSIQAAHPDARIGSYPNTDFNDGRYKVKIAVESRSPAALAHALEAVEEQLETFRL